MNINKEIISICCEIEKCMSKKMKKEFINKKFCDLYDYHFSLGACIRNNILTEKSALMMKFKKIGVTNLDDISYLVIQNLYIYLKEKST